MNLSHRELRANPTSTVAQWHSKLTNTIARKQNALCELPYGKTRKEHGFDCPIECYDEASNKIDLAEAIRQVGGKLDKSLLQ